MNSVQLFMNSYWKKCPAGEMKVRVSQTLFLLDVFNSAYTSDTGW